MTAIEIPLNSPDPFRSIGAAVKLAPSGVLIGAGTVLARRMSIVSTMSAAS